MNEKNKFEKSLVGTAETTQMSNIYSLLDLFFFASTNS